MSGTVCKSLFVLGLTFGTLGGVDSFGSAGGPPQRLRPPSSLQCSRDRLTSFQGRILEYRRGKQEISMRVRTDEETTENFTLKWEADGKAEALFLLRGEEFTSEDWKRIESGPGKLHEGMRVVVWVCGDESKPVFDWRPPEK
jgi:hypothetical protein